MTTNQKVLMWLGQWRDNLPAQAVKDLQNIVKSKPLPAQQFYAEQIAGNTGAEYLAQYHEFINLLFNGDIPAEGILKLESQLTYDQFEKVLLKASGQGKRLSDLMSAMANNSDYTKNRKSLFLILNTWLNRD